MLGVLPFFHVFAHDGRHELRASRRAAEIIIMPRFVLDDALKLIDQTQADDDAGRADACSTPCMNHPKLKSFDLSSLKFCLSGGAPLPLEVKQQLRGADRLQAGRGLRPVGGLARSSPAIRSTAR